jgi:RNA polymerase sigma-70 factor, ECF subfamily
MRRGNSDVQARFQNEMAPHMDILLNYANYLTGDKAAAEDLLQETYLKAYRFFEKFDEGTNAKAWLYRIMRNTYINEYRRVKRIPDVVQYDEQLSPYQMNASVLGSVDELRERIDRETFGDEIAGAIGGLPEKFKSVVILRDVENLPYEEIAEALEIPVGTVRSRLHRARAMLFEKLRTYALSRGYEVPETFVPQSALALAG